MKRIIYTENASKPIGPYSQGVLIDEKTLYVSGCVGIIPSTGEVIAGTVQDETRQIMQNLSAILKAAGMDFSNVVKATIFLTDMNDFAQMNEIYGSFFTGDYPARETVQVSKLPKNVRVEISVIAVK
ncbi:MAG: RidA family protein [Bacteroidota bacterium]